MAETANIKESLDLLNLLLLYFLLVLLLPFLFISNIAKASQITASSNGKPIICKQAAAYIPGIDVNGKRVVPADLIDDKSEHIYDPVIIPIDIDLAQRFNLPTSNGIELKPQVSWIEIYQDGRILYNGNEVTDIFLSMCNGDEKDDNNGDSNKFNRNNGAGDIKHNGQ